MSYSSSYSRKSSKRARVQRDRKTQVLMFLADWQVKSGQVRLNKSDQHRRQNQRRRARKGRSRRGVRPAFAASAIGGWCKSGDLFTSCSGRSCSRFASLAVFVWVSLALSQ